MDLLLVCFSQEYVSAELICIIRHVLASFANSDHNISKMYRYSLSPRKNIASFMQYVIRYRRHQGCSPQNSIYTAHNDIEHFWAVN